MSETLNMKATKRFSSMINLSHVIHRCIREISGMRPVHKDYYKSEVHNMDGTSDNSKIFGWKAHPDYAPTIYSGGTTVIPYRFIG